MRALATPVVFLVFNRPDSTAKVLAEIAKARPAKMTVVCDGPRDRHPTDAHKVAQVRKLIENAIDWPCELTLDYASENLGCGPRISSGLTAAFDRYDRAIVLEDDTLPHPSFFPYCEAMLERFNDNPEVMHVSGANTIIGQQRMPPADAFQFTKLPEIWGWASWRRAWQKFDYGIRDWPEVRDTNWLASITPNKPEQRMLHNRFNHEYEVGGSPHTWDTSWTYTCLRHGHSVSPHKNLITNIGFGDGSTNCVEADHPSSFLPTEAIDLSKLTEPVEDPDDRLTQLLVTYSHGGVKARRHASLLGRLCSDRLLRKIRRYVYGPTGRPARMTSKCGS